MKILVTYASAHGSTAEVAQFIAETIAQSPVKPHVALHDIETLPPLEADDHDIFILGTPIHGGAILPAMLGFIRRYRSILAAQPVFFWMNCIRILEPDGLHHILTHYVPADFTRDIQPVEIVAFPGKLDITDITIDDRWALSARYDGDKQPEGFSGDYRNWPAMQDWAYELGQWLTQYVAEKPASTTG